MAIQTIAEDDKEIILYGSQYGTAEQYARKLSELMNIPAVSYEDVKAIDCYNRIIYIGALYAGGVLGMKKNFQGLSSIEGKRITIATVGLADPEDEENIRSIRKSMSKQLRPELYDKAEIFHLRGGIDYSKLGFKHRTMMAMLYKKASSLPEEKKTADAKALVETYNQQVNFVDYSRLQEMIR